MGFVETILIFVIIYVILGIILFFILNKWIKKGKQPYTKFTMLMMIISIVSTLVIITSLIMSSLLYEETKSALIAQYKGTPPILPNLDVELNYPKDYSIRNWNFIIEKADDNISYNTKKNSFVFLLRNIGQQKLGEEVEYIIK